MYTLRLAVKDDILPMMKIGHEGLRPHLEKIRDWDQKVEEAGFLQHFELDKVKIIQVNGEDVGYVKVEDRLDHLYLDGIYIARNQRARGLGSAILQDLILSSVKPLQLHVYKINPAKELYLRLGFNIVADEGQRLLMEAGRPQS